MSNRIILVLAGIVIAYFTIYAGDGIYTLVVTDLALPKEQQVSWLTAAMILGVIFAVIGFIVWGGAMAGLLDSKLKKEPPEVVALYAVVELVCLGFLFGVVAGPFTNYGAYPWSWTSKWDWLPLFALVPAVLVVRDVFSEAVAAWRNRKTSKNNVSSIRRDTA